MTLKQLLMCVQASIDTVGEDAEINFKANDKDFDSFTIKGDTEEKEVDFELTNDLSENKD